MNRKTRNNKRETQKTKNIQPIGHIASLLHDVDLLTHRTDQILIPLISSEIFPHIGQIRFRSPFMILRFRTSLHTSVKSRSDQIRSDQIRSDQIRSDQIPISLLSRCFRHISDQVPISSLSCSIRVVSRLKITTKYRIGS